MKNAQGYKVASSFKKGPMQTGKSFNAIVKCCYEVTKKYTSQHIDFQLDQAQEPESWSQKRCDGRRGDVAWRNPCEKEIWNPSYGKMPGYCRKPS